jgi:hypothetical protein
MSRLPDPTANLTMYKNFISVVLIVMPSIRSHRPEIPLLGREREARLPAHGHEEKFSAKHNQDSIHYCVICFLHPI